MSFVLFFGCENNESNNNATTNHNNFSLVLLLTCDGILIGNDVLIHILRHLHALVEERHRRVMLSLEERIAAVHEDITHHMNHDDDDDNDSESHADDSDDNVSQSDEQHRLEQESHSIEQQIQIYEANHARRTANLDTIVFIMETGGSFAVVAHYLHVWAMHGMSFGLMDAVLFLHIQSTLSSVGRKVSRSKIG